MRFSFEPDCFFVEALLGFWAQRRLADGAAGVVLEVLVRDRSGICTSAFGSVSMVQGRSNTQ